MTFSEFSERIVNVTKMELPGEQYHLEMAPLQRILELKRKAREMNTARKAGVMVLFYPDIDDETRFVLILRKSYKGVHSGQVGLPGGKLELGDSSLCDAALRETEEEVGVSASKISVLKELTELYIPPSNFFVQPYLGIVYETPNFKAEEFEVERIIEVSLTHFMDYGTRITQNLSTSYAQRVEVPAFLLNNHVVWGATAMILNELSKMLNELLRDS